MELKKSIEILKSYENKLVYEISEKDKEAVAVVLNHLTKQERMIELMADWIGQADNDDGMCMYINECNEKCGECVKQYFENKVEESDKNVND